MTQTFTVLMRSRTAWPGQTVTYRSNDDGFQADRPCRYVPERSAWLFTVDRDAIAADGLTFKYLCQGQWQDDIGPGVNLQISKQDLQDTQVMGREFLAHFPPTRPIVDEPAPARLLFAPTWSPAVEWDVIIIGSGIGGGVLAHALASDARAPAKVLVLEAGSYLSPTHTGNLARRHNLGVHVDKSIWSQWNDFRVQDYLYDGPAGECHVAQGINLGGRSIFWGATTPRLSCAELGRGWPDPVAGELARWYPRAEELLRVSGAPGSTYQSQVLGHLRGLFPDMTHTATPVAVEYQPQVHAAIPGGIFSTATLLLEARLQQPERDKDLTVHLNEPVTLLTTLGPTNAGPTRISQVSTRAATDGTVRSYGLAENGQVVLAAGTVGSAALALASGLQVSSDPRLIGAGLTDHPVYYLRFRIPRGSRFSPAPSPLLEHRLRRDSSKTLSRYEEGGCSYNLLLELGTNLNQSRFVSDREVKVVEAGDDDGNWCEAVFLLDASLLPDNRLALQDGRTHLKMERVTVTDVQLTRIHEQALALLVSFGAEPVDQSGSPVKVTTADDIEKVLFPSALGEVSHEVGTMRMGDDKTLSVVDTDLKVRGHENLYVCDLSVFPTSPASNPTLTLAALALRLADHLLSGSGTQPGPVPDAPLPATT